jgi:hypothetical protein
MMNEGRMPDGANNYHSFVKECDRDNSGALSYRLRAFIMWFQDGFSRKFEPWLKIIRELLIYSVFRGSHVNPRSGLEEDLIIRTEW